MLSIRKFVIYPVTPNGVEHRPRISSDFGAPPVIYPVTPNGVEHSNADGWLSFVHSDLSGNA